jgi:methionine salvage enolase-phosphatase E1
VGAKTETESYIRIAQTLTRSPHDFLFISDAVNEVIAANDVGMQAILCNRDAHASQSRASVNERVKEIGTMKDIGAKPLF